MGERRFYPANILLPKNGTNLQKWAVLACDQYTSEPAYWQAVEGFVAGAPSTLHMVLPEVYLEGEDVPDRIEAIHAAMHAYEEAPLETAATGFVYIRRTLADGSVREGLVGSVDLEDYSYEPGAQCRIRPSESTVLERIPPRLAVRRGAPLETPHILMLIDDEEGSVIEPLGSKRETLRPLYSFTLMQDSGHLAGWAVEAPEDIAAIEQALEALEDATAFRARYHTGKDTAPFLMAVGDGNHSLATAKAYWEELKPALTAQERKNHPARYCLVELENIQSPAIQIEPIHRVLFGGEVGSLLDQATSFAKIKGTTILMGSDAEQEAHQYDVVVGGISTDISLLNSIHPMATGALDAFLETLCKDNPALRVDYVHGDGSVRALAAEGAVGILLPPFQKSDLFRGVALGGVLPKKTFSMGHAPDKRMYMECRKIEP